MVGVSNDSLNCHNVDYEDIVNNKYNIYNNSSFGLNLPSKATELSSIVDSIYKLVNRFPQNDKLCEVSVNL